LAAGGRAFKQVSGLAHKYHARPERQTDVYDDGYLRVEYDSYYVSCGGTPVFLSRKEFLIISLFTRNPGRVVSADEIWRHVWRETSPINFNAFKVQIHRLRRRLSPFGINVENQLNTGYRLTSVQGAGNNGKQKKLRQQPSESRASGTNIGN
jgi:DNA-binding response OmpR family regulator